jgi:hypothetical protein
MPHGNEIASGPPVGDSLTEDLVVRTAEYLPVGSTQLAFALYWIAPLQVSDLMN